MCNLYRFRLAPSEIAHLFAHRELIGRDYLDVLHGKNDETSVYPDYEAPVISARLGEMSIEPMRWGFPPPPFVNSKAPVTNVRNVAKGFWKPCLGRENRCLVPASSYGREQQRAVRAVYLSSIRARGLVNPDFGFG